MNILKKFEPRELEPLTGNLSAVRLKLDSGDGYVGIGTLVLDGNGIIGLEFEWLVRLMTDSRGEDGFERNAAVAVAESLKKKGYRMQFRPIGLVPGSGEWETIETDEGKILLSFDEKQTELIKKVKEHYDSKGYR